MNLRVRAAFNIPSFQILPMNIIKNELVKGVYRTKSSGVLFFSRTKGEERTSGEKKGVDKWSAKAQAHDVCFNKETLDKNMSLRHNISDDYIK